MKKEIFQFVRMKIGKLPVLFFRMPRACPIGIYAISGANVFAAAPPDVRKVFDLPGEVNFFPGLRPLLRGATTTRRSLPLQKVEKASAHQAAQPRGAQPLKDRPPSGRSKTFRTSGGAAARKARENGRRYQWDKAVASDASAQAGFLSTPIRLLAALMLLWLATSNAFAQSASAQSSDQTADDLVRYALEHNGELQAARQMIAEARGRLRQAGLKPNPMLETSGTQAVTSPDNNQMIGIELPLELGGRRKARVTVAEREVEMREAEVRDFERRLAGEVRMKYADAVAAARNLRFTENLIDLMRNSHQLVKARVELGKSAPLEQNLVWVELNKADATRIGFESKTEVTMLELKKIAGMPPEESLQLRGEFEPERQPPPQNEALRRAIESRPDLAALRAAESLASAQVEQARVEGRVDASLFANYERMNFGYGVRGFNDAGALAPVTGVFHYATFGLRLTLPVRNKNQGLIEVATAAGEAARKRREFAELVVRNELAAAYTRWDRAQAALAVYRDRLRDAAMRNVDVLGQAYALGQKTVLDYLAEQRRFIEVETGFTDLLKERLDALIEIERVAGLPPLSTKQNIQVEK